LHPTEFWWLVEAKRRPKMYGRLTEQEVDDMIAEAKAEGMM
jgi:hypothetical protein